MAGVGGAAANPLSSPSLYPAARAAPGLGRGCARSPAAQGGAGPFCLCGDRDRDPMPAVTCCPAQPLGPCCPYRRWAVLEPEGFCSAGYLSTLSTTGGSGRLSSPELPRSGWVGSPHSTSLPEDRQDRAIPSMFIVTPEPPALAHSMRYKDTVTPALRRRGSRVPGSSVAISGTHSTCGRLRHREWGLWQRSAG